MNRITGKARDETLIELQSTTDTHTGGNSIKKKREKDAASVSQPVVEVCECGMLEDY